MRRRARRKQTQSPKALIIFGVVLFITIGLVFNAVSAFLRSRNFQKDNNELTTTIEQKQEDIKALEDKLDMLKSGEGLELEARARLNLRRPDEKVVIIVDDKQNTKKDTVDSKKSLWTRITNWFNL
ncbi:MAG: septum formation initiator family protein [bacterium]|nr:septum formation initiator family protein [bacterium]